MKVLVANTYTESYGVEITLFGVFETREQCIERMIKYNTEEVPRLQELSNKLKNYDFGEDEYMDIVAEIHKYGAEEFNKVFVFNLEKPDRYIKDFTGDPLNLGGYAE